MTMAGIVRFGKIRTRSDNHRPTEQVRRWRKAAEKEVIGDRGRVVKIIAPPNKFGGGVRPCTLYLTRIFGRHRPRQLPILPDAVALFPNLAHVSTLIVSMPVLKVPMMTVVGVR